jgi:hypothetical protein
MPISPKKRMHQIIKSVEMNKQNYNNLNNIIVREIKSPTNNCKYILVYIYLHHCRQIKS